jgi:hypothetical protein
MSHLISLSSSNHPMHAGSADCLYCGDPSPLPFLIQTFVTFVFFHNGPVFPCHEEWSALFQALDLSQNEPLRLLTCLLHGIYFSPFRPAMEYIVALQVSKTAPSESGIIFLPPLPDKLPIAHRWPPLNILTCPSSLHFYIASIAPLEDAAMQLQSTA